MSVILTAHTVTDTARYGSQLRFFQEGAITAHKKSKKGVTTIGKNAPRRGRPKKNEGNCDAYEYLENPDGTTVSERDYAIARGFTCDFLDICKALEVHLPDSWKDIDVRVKSIYYLAIRKVLTVTQLCQNNTKAKTLITGVYYDTIVRRRKKAAASREGAGFKPKAVMLEDARYTMHEPGSDAHVPRNAPKSVHSGESSGEDSALSDSDSDAAAFKPHKVAVPKVSRTSASSAKRPLGDCGVSSNPSKKARMTPSAFSLHIFEF